MSIFDFIREISNPLLDNIFLFIINSFFLIPLIIATIILINLNKQKKLKNIEKFKYIFPLILAVLLTLLLATGIKEIIKEDRPCKMIPNIHNINCKEDSSFPSRHTAIAFSTIPFIIFNRKFFILLFLYACLVGIGMIYLGLHYPHDVLAGMIIGYLIGAMCYSLFKKFQQHQKY